MANLTVENLSKIVDTGDVQGLMGGLSGAGGGAGGVSESRVLDTMRAEGMQAPQSVSAKGGSSFSDMLRESVGQVNQDQHNADTAIKEMVAGRNKNIHETMLAIEKADTSLKLMMQVRNKVLDAYREIMRMQV